MTRLPLYVNSDETLFYRNSDQLKIFMHLYEEDFMEEVILIENCIKIGGWWINTVAHD